MKGDRVIAIDAGGNVRLQELGAHGTVQSETAGTYRLGRRDRRLYLALADGGQIEVTNRDTLVYYRDTYRRTPLNGIPIDCRQRACSLPICPEREQARWPTRSWILKVAAPVTAR